LKPLPKTFAPTEKPVRIKMFKNIGSKQQRKTWDGFYTSWVHGVKGSAHPNLGENSYKLSARHKRMTPN
jgi:hypothetical protein